MSEVSALTVLDSALADLTQSVLEAKALHTQAVDGLHGLMAQKESIHGEELAAAAKVLEDAKAAHHTEIEQLRSLVRSHNTKGAEPLRHDSPLELKIAAICHEANRMYCRGIGDGSQPAWDDAPAWQVSSAVQGVRAIRDGEVKGPGDSHRSWLKVKEAEGWAYGPVKDVAAKVHPCMVPFEMLSPEQQAKDHLFFTIASTLLQVLK